MSTFSANVSGMLYLNKIVATNTVGINSYALMIVGQFNASQATISSSSFAIGGQIGVSGNLTLQTDNKLLISDTASVTVGSDLQIIATAATINITANVTARSISIQGQELDLYGVLSTSGGGYLGSGAAAQPGSGPGAGQKAANGVAGGAGHGGSSEPAIGGGVAYDSTLVPTLPGSSGASASNSATAGGSGGGVVVINATILLLNHGIISADGTAGKLGSGGGSGGSVYLYAATIKGGVISANGGAGSSASGASGGGGAGGRIAIYYSSDYFTYSVQTQGGAGSAGAGAPGTVLISGVSGVTLTVDNGGLPFSTSAPNVTYPTGGVAWILDDLSKGFALSQLTVIGNAQLAFHPPISSVVIVCVIIFD